MVKLTNVRHLKVLITERNLDVNHVSQGTGDAGRDIETINLDLVTHDRIVIT